MGQSGTGCNGKWKGTPQSSRTGASHIQDTPFFLKGGVTPRQEIQLSYYKPHWSGGFEKGEKSLELANEPYRLIKDNFNIATLVWMIILESWKESSGNSHHHKELESTEIIVLKKLILVATPVSRKMSANMTTTCSYICKLNRW